MGEEEAISLIQKSNELTPEIRRLLKSVVCEKWPQVFPFSNWCDYTQVIQDNHKTFLENALDNVIRGNEVINL